MMYAVSFFGVNLQQYLKKLIAVEYNILLKKIKLLHDLLIDD